MPVINFLSDVCAFFTHYFYISGDVLYLGDMLLDAGSETLDEFDYFDAGYEAMNAVSQIKSQWTTFQAVEDFVDEVRTAKYIKSIPNSVIASIYSVSSGTADGTEIKKLIDSGATFSTDGVVIGDVAQNTTDNTSSVIVAVSETAIELQDDIFVSGETYVVGPSFPYGQEINVTPYHDTKSNVTTALQNILAVLSKSVGQITIPLSTSLPDPGKKITFTDDQLVVDTTTWIRARSLSYDFENEEVIIKGEGVIT